ncbi:MAG TPA: ribosome-associated translation inhibitor RaiA [Nitrospiraceae bacterium]|jgi:putative sigma-54 modulation protein|nr:ribosome-associated translation inhibitor RaiA [Nitrospiraceae bacterium]
MNIIVNGRHLEVTPALRSYAEEKIGKFERYLSNITEATVTLVVEKYRHKTEVLLKANGVMIQAEGITGDIYSSIDEVVEKLEKQVKKYKEKMVSYRKGEGKSVPSPMAEGISAPAPERARIIKKERLAMKPMSPDEAALQMELLDKDFFIFSNDASGEINVIYHRNDGNYGLIEPVK